MTGLHLAVVGGGVFGAATADAAARAGWRVTLYEAESPPAPGASSHDLSKVIRATYGSATPRYGPLTLESMAAWEALQHGRPTLLHRAGVLLLGRSADRGTFLGDSVDGMAALGHPVEVVDPSEGARRWPQLGWDGVGAAVYSADAGWLSATEAVRALVARAEAHGALVRSDTSVVGLDDDADGVLVRTATDARRHDRVVVAAGPWIRQLVPAAPATPTKQHVVWFRPDRPERFAAPHLPVWIDDLDGAGWYGFPAHPDGVVKLGHHTWSEPVEPGDPRADRAADPRRVAQARTVVARRLPGLAADAPAQVRACLYTNSPSGDVVVDRVPGRPRLVVAGLGSGHGFKLGPAIGRLAVEATLGAPAVLPWPTASGRAVW